MRKRLRCLWLALPPLLVWVGGWWCLPWCVDLPPALLQPRAASVRFLARDGEPLRQLLTKEGDRVAAGVSLNSLPKHVIQAMLAAEDKRFEWHGGVDLLAVARAAWDNARAGRIVSGASTVPQQLIKISQPQSGPRSLGVKMMEALQARRLCLSWPRDRVLEEYLNRVSFGNLLTGVAAAASGYFNKPPSDLSVAEAALLAALPQSPSRFNPFRHLQAILPRQQRVLNLMHEHGWITDEQWHTARAEKITLQRFHGGFAAPHAVEMLRQQTPAPPLASTTDLRTTLDPHLQRQVERMIQARLAYLQDRHVTHGAAVVIDNATGDILALAGSRDFFSPDGGQINGAWSPSSPGSALKPFTYLLAFERGASPASMVADLSVEFPTATGLYRPENYAHRLYGPMTFRDALGNSLNISAVKVLAAHGGPSALHQRLQELGLTTLKESAEHYGLGLTLGNAPVRLVELTNAYATLARLGLHKPWRLLSGAPEADAVSDIRLFSATNAYWIADILSDNQARLLTFGPHSPLRLPFRAAVKTGTSQSYRDNWTIGYTPDFTVGVWTGNFDRSPMQDVSGVTGAAPIWRDILLHLHHKHSPTWYPEPGDLQRTRIDPRTGHRLSAQSPPSRVSREELLPRDRLPPFASSLDYDARGRALLSAEYASWLRSADQWMGDVVALAAEPKASSWRIVSPLSGTVIHLDADLPEGGRRLFLETQPPREVVWQCDSLPVHAEGPHRFVWLTPGRHRLTARDLATGETRDTQVIVHSE